MYKGQKFLTANGLNLILKRRFVELVNTFIEEIITAGTVNDVLVELGWNKVQKKWLPPQVVSSQSIDLRVPALA